ncbi:MAG: HEAT repeat domain-containing protein [Thermoguttaceae bacterium]
MKHSISLTLLAVFTAMFVVLPTAFASDASTLFEESVPKMNSSDLGECQKAQQDWQTFCRQTGADKLVQSEINKLSIAQLAKENPVNTTVWIVRQLGFTGDASVVPTLSKLLENSEVRIANEAAAALARIPAKEAAAALKASKSEIAKNALHARESDRGIYSKFSKETKMPAAIPFANAADLAAWMKNFDKLGNVEKAQTLSNLAVRGDKKYLPVALKAAENEDATVRNAGIFAVGALGGTENIPFLLKSAFDGESRDQAKCVLSQMVDSNFDAALIAAMKNENDPGRFEIIADILSKRFNSEMRPVLIEQALKTDCPNRLTMIRIAEALAGKEHAGDFVAVWALFPAGGERDQAEQIIARLVNRDADPVLAKRTEQNAVEMFSLLGRIGDDKTLKEIDDVVFKKVESKPEFVAGALRALCNWPNAKAAESLMKIVKEDGFAENDKIAALRGYIRVISLPNDQIGIQINDKQKLEKLAEAIDLAKRIDEKRLVIQRCSQIRQRDTLAFIMKFYDDEELKDAVCRSVLDMLHHTDFRRNNKDVSLPALEKVAKGTTDAGLLDRVKRYQDNM